LKTMMFSNPGEKGVPATIITDVTVQITVFSDPCEFEGRPAASATDVKRITEIRIIERGKKE
jgi:hypothetical protein